MEDWEEFFLEKSRRRFEKERLERRVRNKNLTLAATIVTILVLGTIIALALLS